MTRRLFLLIVLFALLAGCQPDLDLAQVRLILFQDAEGSMKLSHAVCPRCGESSVLDRGQFVPADIEASCDNVLQYGSTSISKRLGIEAKGMYCPVCGLSKASFVPKILSMEDFK